MGHNDANNPLTHYFMRHFQIFNEINNFLKNVSLVSQFPCALCVLVSHLLFSLRALVSCLLTCPSWPAFFSCLMFNMN